MRRRKGDLAGPPTSGCLSVLTQVLKGHQTLRLGEDPARDPGPTPDSRISVCGRRRKTGLTRVREGGVCAGETDGPTAALHLKETSSGDDLHPRLPRSAAASGLDGSVRI